MTTYKVINKVTGQLQIMTLEMIIEEINRDRSEEWTDYDETDWREGLEEFTDYEIVKGE